jgi:hypothetical protein
LGFRPITVTGHFEILFLIALVAIITVLAWRFFHHLRD